MVGADMDQALSPLFPRILRNVLLSGTRSIHVRFAAGKSPVPSMDSK